MTDSPLGLPLFGAVKTALKGDDLLLTSLPTKNDLNVLGSTFSRWQLFSVSLFLACVSEVAFAKAARAERSFDLIAFKAFV